MTTVTQRINGIDTAALQETMDAIKADHAKGNLILCNFRDL